MTLGSGESEVLLFDLAYDDFAWYDPATQTMKARPGRYTIAVGGTSDPERQRTYTVELK